MGRIATAGKAAVGLLPDATSPGTVVINGEVHMDLVGKWREEAMNLRDWGCDNHADAIERCAAELEAHQREAELEAMTIEDAARESGYSTSALYKKVASGQLQNVGRKNAPRVRRSDLPRKARTHTPSLADRVLERAS